MASDRDLTSPWAHSMGPSVAPILAWPVIRNPLFPRTSHPQGYHALQAFQGTGIPTSPVCPLLWVYLLWSPYTPWGLPPPSEPCLPLCVYPLATMHLLCEGCFLLAQGLLTSSGWGSPADLSTALWAAVTPSPVRSDPQPAGRGQSVQSLSRVQLSATSLTAACQASLYITNSRACSNSCPSSWWCHPTLSSSVIPFSSCHQSFPASGSFPVSQFFLSDGQSIGSFSFSISPSNEYSGLISFRMDWLDLLAVQVTLKSLL